MMDQLRDFADERLVQGCIYCGGLEETREHVPSRVFLDKPYPANLPVVPSCLACNNGFSLDEEYLVCLIECVLAGSTDPSTIRRSRVAAILERSPALRARLEASRSSTDGQTWFQPDDERVGRIITKLARGHAAFELSSSLVMDEPTELVWWPRTIMSAEQIEEFDAPHVPGVLGEVGSRGMQRMQVVEVTLTRGEETYQAPFLMNDWVLVQEGSYRYLAIDAPSGIAVRLVVAEFLAAEVRWSEPVGADESGGEDSGPDDDSLSREK